MLISLIWILMSCEDTTVALEYGPYDSPHEDEERVRERVGVGARRVRCVRERFGRIGALGQSAQHIVRDTKTLAVEVDGFRHGKS